MGFRALYNLMHQPSKELYGLSVEATSGVLGEILSSGSAAVVFRRKESDNVLKISRFGFKDDVENELKILNSTCSTTARPS